jgi:hypothetical protein
VLVWPLSEYSKLLTKLSFKAKFEGGKALILPEVGLNIIVDI